MPDKRKTDLMSPEQKKDAVLRIATGQSMNSVAMEIDVSPDTLRRWRDQDFKAVYGEAKALHEREMEERVVEAARVNAERALQVQAQLLERMLEAEGKEQPQALRAVNDVMGKNLEKMLALTGRPTQITQNGDAMATLSFLKAAGVLKLPDVHEGSATEVPPGPGSD